MTPNVTVFRESMSEPRLEVNDALGRRIVTIEKVPFLIGRRVESDLHLPSAEVSRDHAEIVSTGDAYVLNDRGSLAPSSMTRK